MAQHAHATTPWGKSEGELEGTQGESSLVITDSVSPFVLFLLGVTLGGRGACEAPVRTGPSR